MFQNMVDTMHRKSVISLLLSNVIKHAEHFERARLKKRSSPSKLCFEHLAYLGSIHINIGNKAPGIPRACWFRPTASPSKTSPRNAPSAETSTASAPEATPG